MKGMIWGLALMLAPTAASAHTSYLKPNSFGSAEANAVTIEASFTEDFLRPEIPVESQDWHLYRPDGLRDTYDNVVVLRQMTVLESDLTEPGTYRFTTGERLGRTSTQARIDGQWRPLEPGAAAPAGAPTRQSQTATVADVYVTKGAPSDAVLGIAVGHLAIRPLTHPSAIFLDDGFRFRVAFDGAPLANQDVNVYRDGGIYDETPFHQVFRTDSNGELHLSFDRPGAYLIMTRHSADAPAGSATQIRSYTTSLTFEVTR
ncbi:MAG: DUF4198 domain-containing protein [Terricaulis sp.]